MQYTIIMRCYGLWILRFNPLKECLSRLQSKTYISIKTFKKQLFETVTNIFLKIAYIPYGNLYGALKSIMFNYILLVGICLCQIPSCVTEINALNIFIKSTN